MISLHSSHPEILVHTITPIVVLLTITAAATSLARAPPTRPRGNPDPTLTDSQWVRLPTPELRRAEGRLLTQGQSEVVITDGSRPVHVPMAAVDTLWTRGRSSGTGALVGAILFAGLGVVLATSSSTGLKKTRVVQGQSHHSPRLEQSRDR